MVLGLVFFQLVTPSAAVVAEVALERFVVEVNSFVSHEVALLHEALATCDARVRPDSHVATHVTGELAPFRSGIITVHELALKYVACNGREENNEK